MFQLNQGRKAAPLKLLSSMAIAVGILFSGLALSAAPANAADAPTAAASPSSTDISSDFAIGGIIKDGSTPVAGVKFTVTGKGFTGNGATAADGRWKVAVPSKGTYTVKLDVTSLPAGSSLRSPNDNPKQVTINLTNTQNVLFVLNPSSTPHPTETTPGQNNGGQQGQNLVLGRLIAGLNLGILLAMAAIGLSLIYGTTALNNFAHGEMVTLGALLAFTFNKVMGMDLFLAAFLTMIIVAASGWAQDALLWRPLRKKRIGLTQMMIVSIGFSILVRYVFLFFYGGETKVLSQGDIWDFFGVRLQAVNVLNAVIAIFILLAFSWFLTRTRIGKATRAVADNSSLAAASGIDVERIIRIVWVVAGALTGIAGVMLGLYFQAGWDMGFTILLLIFAAVTLGGLGTAFGAAVGAMIIGLFVELSTLVIPDDLKIAGALVILILVLLIRPQGVLGKKQRIG